MRSDLANQRGAVAELWHVQPDLMNARDQHAQIVGGHLAQHFVELTDLRLADRKRWRSRMSRFRARY